MPEQSFRIGKSWTGSLSKLAVEANWGVPGIDHTLPAAEIGRKPDLVDANIIRAGGSVEQIFRPAVWVEVSPGDSIQVGEYILRLT